MFTNFKINDLFSFLNKYSLEIFFTILLTVLIIFGIIIPNLYIEEKPEVYEPSIPSNYHIFYDDENKMIIAPKEYHFKSDEKGNLYLTK